MRDEHKNAYGVEPICRQLPIAPSTYYAARSRPPSARAIEDEALKAKMDLLLFPWIGISVSSLYRAGISPVGGTSVPAWSTG